MSQLLEQVGELIHAVILQLGYPGIAAIMLIENLFPPIPSEMVMPFAGFLAGRGELSIIGVWLAGTLGSVLGALVLYYVGLWASNVVVRRFLRRYGKWIAISEADYDRALRFFERYGDAVVFFGRFIPLVRSLISIPAGAHRMPLPRFLLFTTLGSAIWSGVLGYAGVVLGENWEQVLDFIDHYQSLTIVIIVVIVVLLIVGWVALKARRSRAANNAAPEA